MAGELKGKNYRTAGSDDYFATLNRGLRINFMGDEPREYYASLSECGKNGAAVIEKIYEDLKSAAPVVRYFPEDSRKNLVSFIRGAEAVMKITGASCSDADKCVDYLELKASEVRLSSGLSQYNVDAAAKELCGKLRKEEAAALLEAAKKNGIEYAARGNSTYYNLLTQTFSRSGRNLMGDVFYKLDYDYNKSRYKGKKSGKDMASGDYISWAEEGVFGKKVGENLRFDYGKVIIQDLQAIGDAIKGDVEDGGKNGNYITTSNAALMRAGAASIMWCGVTGLDEIGREVDKLCYYVGGDEEKIKELQEILNFLEIHGASRPLEVDGVLTPETLERIGMFYRSFDFDKILEISITINKILEGLDKSGILPDDFMYVINNYGGEKFYIFNMILSAIKLVPQIMTDIQDDNDTIEKKTIEDISRTAFQLYYSFVIGGIGTGIGAYFGGTVGLPKIGGAIGGFIGAELGAKYGEHEGEEFSDSIIKIMEAMSLL